MNVDSKSSLGEADGTLGEGTENDNPENPNNPEAGENGKKPVPYDVYDRVMRQNKAARERLDAFEAEQKKRSEAEMRAKEQYKELLDAKEKEINDFKEKHEKLVKKVEHGQKLRAVLDAVNGSIEREYFDLIPVDMVEMNSETGLPDKDSVQKAVKILETKYSRIITPKSATNLPPSDAAKGATGKLSYEAWTKLPDSEKSSRMKDVDPATM